MKAEPRRFPLLATLMVLVAVGVMVRLGLWQIDRLHQKEALLARYAAAAHGPPVPWPFGSQREGAYYRRSALDCTKTERPGAMAGQNAKGEAGWAHIIHCDGPNGSGVVVLGWSNDPARREWPGGHVEGIVAPFGKGAARLVADPPLAGLQPNAKPDPANIPNNHLSYAVQWFLFAATALAIYAIALFKRLKR